MVQPLQSPSNFLPHEMNDRSPTILEKIPFQKPSHMQEDHFSYLEQVEHEMKEEEIVDDPAEAALDRLVALLNWTLLSALVYMVLNSSYLFGVAFRAPYRDASTRELLQKLGQITNGPMLHHSFSTLSAQISSHYTLYRALVYTNILLGFVVAFIIILGKSFMGRYTLDLTTSFRRHPRHLSNPRTQSLPLPTWFRLILECLPTAFPFAQVVFTTALLFAHHFAL